MNHFCTNCGKKLEDNVIKCDSCNTYVVDLKGVNKKKLFRMIIICIITVILGILFAIIGYNLYYDNLHKSIYKKYLKTDFKGAEYVRRDFCYECTSSCDGGCMSTPKIIGCFKYYYRSSSNIGEPDIVVFFNKGDISIDSYSKIINRYGFEDKKDEEDNMYHTRKRDFLYIEVDEINSRNITRIYNMVHELIDIYEKDNKQSFYIDISTREYNYSIVISNFDTNNKFTFEWDFNHRTKLLNPNLEDVKQIYNY